MDKKSDTIVFYVIEVAQYTKYGRRLLVEGKVIPQRDSQGAITGYVAVNREITARRAAEDALLASERTYRELAETLHVERSKLAAVAIDHLPVGVSIQDDKGNTLSLNVACWL